MGLLRKTKGISSIRYKGTCTKMSHEQTTSVHKTFKHDGHNRTTEVTSSQRSITHLWLLQRTNKYVLTKNLQMTTTEMQIYTLSVFFEKNKKCRSMQNNAKLRNFGKKWTRQFKKVSDINTDLHPIVKGKFSLGSGYASVFDQGGIVQLFLRNWQIF